MWVVSPHLTGSPVARCAMEDIRRAQGIDAG
jgi:hypothetical protein